LKLDRRAKRLKLVDWFVPFDVVQSNKDDADLCAGPVVLPWGDLIGAWGKDRAYYILHAADMGKYTPGQNRIAQFAPDMTKAQNPGHDGQTGHIHCAPVMFSDPSLGPVSYVWGENDRLRGYRFHIETQMFETQSPPNLVSDQALPVGMPGGMLSISCKGTDPDRAKGTAILWTLHPTAGNANHQTVAGTLQAFRADDLRQPIWSSNHDPQGTDDLGDFAKFCPPVVANGKVYVATFSQQLAVYGLLAKRRPPQLGKWTQADIPVQDPAGDRTFKVEGTASYSCHRFTILGAGSDIWGKEDEFHYVYRSAESDSLTLSARIVSVQRTSEWAKAGVMIRNCSPADSTNPVDADSAYAMVAITPGHGAIFQYRPRNGQETVAFSSPASAPYWVKLSRSIRNGSFELAGFVSPDGSEWRQIGNAVPISMQRTSSIGMAVTAHTNAPNEQLNDLCVAVFDRVTVT
jgi:hypothetical protein